MDIAYTRCTCRHIVDTAKVYMDIGIANRNKRHPHVVYILLIIKFYHQLPFPTKSFYVQQWAMIHNIHFKQ